MKAQELTESSEDNAMSGVNTCLDHIAVPANILYLLPAWNAGTRSQTWNQVQE